jgi:hypothetical protein
LPCKTLPTPTNPPFERSSKRRKGFPSETRVKRGLQIVHGDKELVEKLGRNAAILTAQTELTSFRE